jgi:hypothetical protein
MSELVERMGVIEEISAERRRQIEVEGWTPEHDDEHANGELARAAASYAISDGYFENISALWPWEDEWFKPKDRRRDLIRAAALLVAEIERLDRDVGIARAVLGKKP